jgi:magnesium chelatase subunit I
VLVGSGNPEEGDLRPQMLDRFGLAVDIKTPMDIPTRVEIMRRRDAFDRDPAAFVARFADDEAKLRQSLVAARQRLNAVTVKDEIMEKTAELCARLGTDGLRGELTLMRAARALASLQQAATVNLGHIRKLAASALGHRLRRDPLDEAGSVARVRRAVDEVIPA